MLLIELINMKKINFLSLHSNENSPVAPVRVESRKSVKEMLSSYSSHVEKNDDYTNFDITKTPIPTSLPSISTTNTEDFSSFSE